MDHKKSLTFPGLEDFMGDFSSDNITDLQDKVMLLEQNVDEMRKSNLEMCSKFEDLQKTVRSTQATQETTLEIIMSVEKLMKEKSVCLAVEEEMERKRARDKLEIKRKQNEEMLRKRRGQEDRERREREIIEDEELIKTEERLLMNEMAERELLKIVEEEREKKEREKREEVMERRDKEERERKEIEVMERRDGEERGRKEREERERKEREERDRIEREERERRDNDERERRVAEDRKRKDKEERERRVVEDRERREVEESKIMEIFKIENDPMEMENTDLEKDHERSIETSRPAVIDSLDSIIGSNTFTVMDILNDEDDLHSESSGNGEKKISNLQFTEDFENNTYIEEFAQNGTIKINDRSPDESELTVVKDTANGNWIMTGSVSFDNPLIDVVSFTPHPLNCTLVDYAEFNTNEIQKMEPEDLNRGSFSLKFKDSKVPSGPWTWHFTIGFS